MKINAWLLKITSFKMPLFILTTIILYLILNLLSFPLIALIIICLGILFGSSGLVLEIIAGLFKKQFALDYIALLAIVTALITQEFLVASIIALMLTSGRGLEEYGFRQAKKSLSLLANRIPQNVTLIEGDQTEKIVKIGNIKVGQDIFIRKGEVLPLDGVLISNVGFTDESSLTGEPYLMEKVKGDLMRSGTINIGNPFIVKVTRPEKDSTYKKLIDMVRAAQREKTPFIRLANKYSTIFTLITLLITAFAYYISNDLITVLAVLVIATPCPLIIATPIALLGGVSKSAGKRIIVKKLSSLEVLSRIDTLVFDKTGTITIGKPELTDIKIIDKSYTVEKVLAIALALERNSLHPIAKTIINYTKDKGLNAPPAKNISEKIGSGISGEIENTTYTLSKIEEDTHGMAIKLLRDNRQIATFHFEDLIKKESARTISDLKSLGMQLHIFTGDRQKVAENIASQINHKVEIHAQMTPYEKQQGIEELKKQHRTIAMIGDGVNDAPALARADVGLVFSSEEQTAASEAADIVLLGGDFSMIGQAIQIAKRTIRIARQSIFWGIGLSTLGMIFAAFGLIPPIYGAAIQETIDIVVIINALRASR